MWGAKYNEKILKMQDKEWVLGIDPGSSRWGFVFLDDGRVVRETTMRTEDVRDNPREILKLVMCARLITAPSGYGVPLKKVSDLTPNDFFEMLLKRDGDREGRSVMGLEKVLHLLREQQVNAYVIPGVKLLPTVPEERKYGKIDMGTPDKLCAAVAGIVEQAHRLKLHYTQTGFILAEIGSGFDAFLAVEGGQIVDGIGGTMASSTWRGEDGELLYLKGIVSKEELMKSNLSAEKVQQGALKDIESLRAQYKPREVLVSGSRSDIVFNFLRARFKNVQRLKTCKCSNAAYGAAIIADGLAGGGFEELVDLIGIKKAKGSNLDYTDLK